MSSRDQIEALVRHIQQAAQDALSEYEKTGPAPSLDSVHPHSLDSAPNTIALKKIVRKLEGACDQLCSTLAPPAHTILNRAQDTYWACMRVAVENKIADVLAEHPDGLHVSDLSAIIRIEPGKLTSVLRNLAARHCFKEVAERVFSNNRLSVKLLSSDPLATYTDLLTRECQLAAYYMPESLVDPVDGPSKDPHQSPFVRSLQDKEFKGTFYDYLGNHVCGILNYGYGMIAMNAAIGTLSVLDAFPWQDFTTVCDVGSGIGAFSVSLLQQYPNMQVTLHDRPETIILAQEMWKREHGAIMEEGRITFAPGNFFEAVPTKDLDLYYLRNILHNWPDAESMLILKAVRGALGPNSRVLIHDYVMQPLNRVPGSEAKKTGLEIAPPPLLPSFGAGQIRLHEQDILMLNIYNARERTIDEVVELGREAGLKLEKVWDLAETSVLEFAAM
ncbi:S-adenosyl-L-methionine-dependent methyltransferase [Lentinula aciculospora]|uniref:S-adenosyl-L-methionine-dependent methyltransferase n=1 Tax=Lentinula aciculospora TaxID=153920 RepID=A0A9W8ZYZ5_9AGAR|nr:S-adenosyl-L-methionine-dependent methyltransferase [Lentinula aciculospora]